MQIELIEGQVAGLEGDAVVTFGFEKEETFDSFPPPQRDWLKEIYASGEFSGKLCELVVLHQPAGLRAKRLAIAGGGRREKFNSQELRKAAGAAVRSLKAKGQRRLTIALGAGHDGPEHVAAAAEGGILGDYEPDQLKTDEKKDRNRVRELRIAVASITDAHRAALERARIVAEAQNLARDLKNEPANRLTPLELASRAQTAAAASGLECEVLDQDRMRQLGMGALLGVAQGSDAPPALIVMRYTPANPVGADHLALIGKGVTFDTGGVSIKPADGMEKMKYDMGGGAAVIGAMVAIGRLKPSVRITAFVPAVENMVSGRAQRPGDIVKSLNGKTVEVLNTDAEGRLILIDAITYAIRQGCTHLVDAATLTGAIVVALGHIHIGGFSNDEALYAKVKAAGDRAGERIWQMPLDEDYKEYLKSSFADLPNIGGRWGGAITAAYFIKEFTEEKPWVHLDIAGTAWLDEGKPWMAKGPSGVPLRTFVELAMGWK